MGRFLVPLAAGLLLAVYAMGWGIAWWTGAPAVQNLATPARPLAAAEVALAADLTGRDATGKPVLRQAGFDRLLKLIAEADDLLVLDQFLVNTFMTGPDGGAPPGRDLAGELAAALVRQKTAVPGLRVLFITDPINGCYRAGCPPALAALPKAGIPVLVTDLDATPGRNWLTGPLQRALEPLLDTLPPARAAVLPNPFGRNAGQLSATDWLRLLSFRANHRKVAACRTRDGRCQALVSSGNPHNASAANGNLAVWLSGPAAGDILRSEVELARGILLRAPDNCHGPVPAWELWRDLDRWPLPPLPAPPPAAAARTSDRPVAPSHGSPGTGDRPVAPTVSFLTDARIGEAAGRLLATAGPGDRVDALLFQLADPPLIRAFQDAARRGACVRLILDSNRSSFGRDKHGIPNQVTAAAMHDWAARHDAPLTIRWFATAGEQGHFKALRVAGSRAAAPDALLTGSANFTGRNLHGYTLEADLLLSPAGAAGRQFDGIFATLWENQDGLVYSEGYPARALAPGPSRWARQLAAALAEITGFCTY
ncbi:MAG: phospholipase D-like domain-containing protein [Lentisphaeria bacterium]